MSYSVNVILVGFLVEKMQYVDFWTDNFRPFSLDHWVNLSRVFWILTAAVLMLVSRHQNAPSSQKRLLVVSVQFENILLMAIRNSTTLRILPWGRPFSRLYLLDMKLFILTWIVLLFRKFCINVGRLPLSPRLCNSFSRPYAHTISNAFSISRKTAIRKSPSICTFLMAYSSWVRGSKVDRPFWKPNWWFTIVFVVSRRFISLFLIIFSISLHSVMVSDMGLNEFGRFGGLPGLGIGIMWAFFHWSGKA